MIGEHRVSFYISATLIEGKGGIEPYRRQLVTAVVDDYKVVDAGLKQNPRCLPVGIGRKLLHHHVRQRVEGEDGHSVERIACVVPAVLRREGGI